jgi:hypothetical protein
VDELLDTMTGVEWQRWLEFNESDPITADRADWRAAQVCSVIAHVNGAKVPPRDFMPKFGPEPKREPMTDEAMRDAAMKIAAMMRGRLTKLPQGKQQEGT